LPQERAWGNRTLLEGGGGEPPNWAGGAARNVVSPADGVGGGGGGTGVCHAGLHRGGKKHEIWGRGMTRPKNWRNKGFRRAGYSGPNPRGLGAEKKGTSRARQGFGASRPVIPDCHGSSPGGQGSSSKVGGGRGTAFSHVFFPKGNQGGHLFFGCWAVTNRAGTTTCCESQMGRPKKKESAGGGGERGPWNGLKSWGGGSAGASKKKRLFFLKNPGGPKGPFGKKDYQRLRQFTKKRAGGHPGNKTPDKTGDGTKNRRPLEGHAGPPHKQCPRQGAVAGLTGFQIRGVLRNWDGPKGGIHITTQGGPPPTHNGKRFPGRGGAGPLDRGGKACGWQIPQVEEDFRSGGGGRCFPRDIRKCVGLFSGKKYFWKQEKRGPAQS